MCAHNLPIDTSLVLIKIPYQISMVLQTKIPAGHYLAFCTIHIESLLKIVPPHGRRR